MVVFLVYSMEPKSDCVIAVADSLEKAVGICANKFEDGTHRNPDIFIGEITDQPKSSKAAFLIEPMEVQS